MTKVKNFSVMITALIFSVGVLSLGYGFWTDSLNIEGNADVRVRVSVVDDIIEASDVSPAALEIVMEPQTNAGEEGDGSSMDSEPVTPAPESDEPQQTDPSITDPGTTPDLPETPPDLPETPQNPAEPVTDPVPEPVSEPAAEPESEPSPANDPGTSPEPATEQPSNTETNTESGSTQGNQNPVETGGSETTDNQGATTETVTP